MKKLLVWCLTLAMVLSIVPAVGVTVTAATDFTDYTGISTVDELKAIEPGHNYYLKNDIVLTGGWAPITFFNDGVLDGNGHTISGVNLKKQCEGGDAWSKAGGLFISLGDGAIVRNLTLKGTMTETAACNNMAEIGGIAATVVAGSTVLIENVTNEVSITSIIENGSVGGFIGCIPAVDKDATPSNVTIRNCVNNGNLAAPLGRLAGFVGTTNGNLTIENSTNNGSIENALYLGGFVGFIDGSADPVRSTTLTNCWNKGAVYTDLDTSKGWPSAGGFIGDTAWIAHNLTMTDCYNLGKVTSNNNGGGMLGAAKVKDVLTDGDYTMKRCFNYGEVKGTVSGGAGGFIKYVASCNMLVEDSANFANITTYTARNAAFIADANWECNLTFKNCANYGDLTTTKTSRSATNGGLIGLIQVNGTYTLEHCVNYGNVTAGINGWTRIAGIIGGTNDNSSANMILRYCANFGAIVGAEIDEAASGHQPLVADLVGSVGGTSVATVVGCYGEGNFTLPKLSSGDTLSDNYVSALLGRSSTGSSVTNSATGYKLQESTAIVSAKEGEGLQVLQPGEDNYSMNQIIISDLNQDLEEEVYSFADDKVTFITAYNKKPITMYGTQETDVNTDGTFDVRLVAIVDSKDYDCAGIELTGTANGKAITTKKYDIKTVYETINNGLLAPKGYYLVTLTVKGISAEDTVTLMATPYVTTADGDVMGAQATITYTNGVRG